MSLGWGGGGGGGSVLGGYFQPDTSFLTTQWLVAALCKGTSFSCPTPIVVAMIINNASILVDLCREHIRIWGGCWREGGGGGGDGGRERKGGIDGRGREGRRAVAGIDGRGRREGERDGMFPFHSVITWQLAHVVTTKILKWSKHFNSYTITRLSQEFIAWEGIECSLHLLR